MTPSVAVADWRTAPPRAAVHSAPSPASHRRGLAWRPSSRPCTAPRRLESGRTYGVDCRLRGHPPSPPVVTGPTIACPLSFTVRVFPNRHSARRARAGPGEGPSARGPTSDNAGYRKLSGDEDEWAGRVPQCRAQPRINSDRSARSASAPRCSTMMLSGSDTNHAKDRQASSLTEPLNAPSSRSA